MQSSNEKELRQAAKSLIKNGECKFNLTKHGEIINHIGFGYRECTDMESKFHSLTIKAASV